MQIYGGITYGRLQAGGFQWPCLAADMADTPVLYSGGMETHRAKLTVMKLSEPPAHDNADYPFLLARGRVLHQPGRDLQIESVDSRNSLKRDEVIELHEEDARELGVSEGEWVEVVHSQGRIRGVVRLFNPRRGLISTTSLFGELITEIEASESPDPMMNVPGLPLTPARIERTVAAAAD